MTHHRHLHIIAPGGGLSPDGLRWIACRPGFILPVRVLSRLFRGLFLEGLAALLAAKPHADGCGSYRQLLDSAQGHSRAVRQPSEQSDTAVLIQTAACDGTRP